MAFAGSEVLDQRRHFESCRSGMKHCGCNATQMKLVFLHRFQCDWWRRTPVNQPRSPSPRSFGQNHRLLSPIEFIRNWRTRRLESRFPRPKTSLGCRWLHLASWSQPCATKPDLVHGYLRTFKLPALWSLLRPSRRAKVVWGPLRLRYPIHPRPTGWLALTPGSETMLSRFRT